MPPGRPPMAQSKIAVRRPYFRAACLNIDTSAVRRFLVDFDHFKSTDNKHQKQDQRCGWTTFSKLNQDLPPRRDRGSDR
jgi:hypothetical protein